MALPNFGEQFKEKFAAVGDWFEQQEWYQEIKSKFDALDPAHKLYAKAGAALLAVLGIVVILGGLGAQVHQAKSEYKEKLGLLALINAANEELKTLKNQIGSNSLAMTDGAVSVIIDTARILPTTSSEGTAVLSTTTSATHPMMIGTARRRIHLGAPRRSWFTHTSRCSGTINLENPVSTISARVA